MHRSGDNFGAKGKHPWNLGLTAASDCRVRNCSVEARSRQSQDAKRRWSDPMYRKSQTEAIHVAANTPQHRAKMSEIVRGLWKNPEYAKKVLRRRIPSGEEFEFTRLSLDNDLKYAYVGNEVLVIDGKNPDFVNLDEHHKIIEIWGDYYKRGRNPQQLIDFYYMRGYQCLIIWASELKHDSLKVIDEVRRFNGY